MRHIVLPLANYHISCLVFIIHKSHNPNSSADYLHQFQAVRISRAILMLTVAVMLAVALMPTRSGYWFDILSKNENELGVSVAGVPAVCFFNTLRLHNCPKAFDQGFSMAISLCLIIFRYSVRCIQLFCKSSSLAVRSLRTLPGDWWKRRVLEKALRHVLDKTLHLRQATSLCLYMSFSKQLLIG
jgi:hypothetical protein